MFQFWQIFETTNVLDHDVIDENRQQDRRERERERERTSLEIQRNSSKTRNNLMHTTPKRNKKNVKRKNHAR